ncbi:PAS domain S-box-containing protein/diguanylate cyclase (GGDEF) domain-containing protein [Granulicella pectinivorans]|uniref:PAS domain S-box-containing protein/diguanylate cyclase (GGDEF) domain-containing protein n=1 Tax=Granulicella pectinivorans TaxID=474950 RepID=A0A1I6LJ11_9BACT|nr:EAL domain-containing protein [Granulicella pectinivorans]SFS03507.1 PAS domain S-box-containing protein/diguanylate cyclase (GGDEF) domain-containing protein [Granulicella pectinivorans]
MFSPPSKTKWKPLAFAGIALLFIGAGWLFWLGGFSQIGSQDFLPHGSDFLWNKDLLTLHVVSDTVIFIAYLSIAATLALLGYRERRKMPLGWLIVAFVLFIVVCALTHVMDIVVLWTPLYWLAGDIKLMTAVASVVTAVALPFFLSDVRSLLDAALLSRQNERRFLAASNSSQDAFYILESVRDGQGIIRNFRFVFVNPNGAKLMSARSGGALEGQMLFHKLPKAVSAELLEAYRQVVERGEPTEQEFLVDTPEVQATWLHQKVVKLDDGIAITATNISARKEDELKLARLAKFTQSIIASSPFATIVTDLEGTIRSMNPAAERMLWYEKTDLVGRTSPLVLLDEQAVMMRAAQLTDELRETVEPGIGVLMAKPLKGLIDESEWKFIRKDGSQFDAQLTVSAMTDQTGVISGLILTAYDITERKRTEDYISHLAHHDALTGLPTRTLFHDRLGVALARAARNRRKVALLMVDLDHFKKVNDLYGHHVGDELLIQVAKRLQGSVRGYDTVARMGGDEFVVLLDDLLHVEQAEAIAEKLITALHAPVLLGTQSLLPAASIGICLYPDSGETAEALLKNADAAMYQMKSEGRNGYQTFTDDMASASTRKRQLEAGLNHALTLNEMELVYQPQISLKSGRVTGVEALLRWRSGKLGLVAPNEFIPLAEESGMIVPIGEWVLKTACREGRALQLEMGRALTIAVNISPRQFQQDALPKTVRETLEENELDPASLELEITENILVSDSPKAMTILEKVRSLGVRVAIDDFGTGFSSMSYIMRFRVDRLKIDQSFVRDMAVNEDSLAVTSAVIALAAGLHITVVAEGVESEAHRDLLASKGCDEAQGYFYSAPVPIERMRELIRGLEVSIESLAGGLGGVGDGLVLD